MAVTDRAVADADAGAAADVRAAPAHPQPGQLTGTWRVVMVVTWIGVVLSWSAVWSVAVQLGQSTWWLGTRASPTSPIVRLAPFLGPVALIVATISNARRLAWGGVAAALVFGAYGIGDLGRQPELGWIEVAIAAAGLVVSVAALSGTYRSAPATHPG